MNLVEIKKHYDKRGYFQEIYSEKTKCPHNDWKQVNFSFSFKGTLRGIHVAPYPKLVTCVHGEVWDCAINLDDKSNNYLKWEGHWLGGRENTMFIPANFGHLFYARHDSVIVYLIGETYKEGVEKTIKYDDPKVNIKLPFNDNYIMSDRDINAGYL